MKRTPILALFVVLFSLPAAAGSLADDGRIGLLVDSQGVTSVKPKMASRWTPVMGEMLVLPGDWLRTGARGANALHVRTGSGAELILGPKSQIELVEAGRAKVSEGEFEVAVAKGQSFLLELPDGTEKSLKDSAVYRVKDGKLEVLKAEPKWLQGFKGAITHESMGELVAKVDGRDVPLTIGYHKVTVDIRDQIARTVVEESFVNHTKSQLEGVFFFPLPEDASISGFGMWIGDELVEADVVEKQRAREIYETILREKRDPGLLEWTGGNIFKARVFPIFPHSEKRIRITYTQVLPMKSGKYRYSYALQSEMLQQNPLRELALDVRVHSAQKVQGISCPTHGARIDMAEHSGHVEFSAEEYTPDRDFEVVVETASEDEGIVVIPHRRGEDGYFVLMLSPPGGEKSDRRLVPDGKPLDFVLLADTSASMDSGQRENQAAFIDSMLGTLGPDDTFNLLACDVKCRVFEKKSVSATGKNTEAALEFLAGIDSLGWSDLDSSLKQAFALAGPDTNLVYVGDGIVTTGDGDAVALANRLKRMYKGKSFTCHSVATGSAFEAVVMNAIASLGGGGFRRIQGPDGSASAAMALLEDVAKPSLKNIKVEFRGFQVARVYPEELANIPAGTQQILTGRYLPQGKSVQAEVVITGDLNGQKRTFKSELVLPGGDEGNSFIPRLWARMHLDRLLLQGRSKGIKDEIIGLSEEYKIMTPYTSFLVLESDADRERFKVKRRFNMRDGEKFFAKGRDEADYELLQKHMKTAGQWRIGLRATMLAQLRTMGRELMYYMPMVPRSGDDYGVYGYGASSLGGGGYAGGYGYGEGLVSQRSSRELMPAASKVSLSSSMQMAAGKKADYRYDFDDVLVDGSFSMDGEFEDSESNMFAVNLPDVPEKALGAEEMYDIPAAGPITTARAEVFEEPPMEMQMKEEASKSIAYNAFASVSEISGKDMLRLRSPAVMAGEFDGRTRGAGWGRFSGLDVFWSRDYAGRPNVDTYYEYWVQQLFPYLAPPAVEYVQPKIEEQWPEEVKQLAELLLRKKEYEAMDGGLKVVSTTDNFDITGKRLNYRYDSLGLMTHEAWLTVNQSGQDQTVLTWCDSKICGTISKAFNCGRVRPSVPLDVANYAFSVGAHMMTPFTDTYLARDYTHELVDLGGGRIRLKLLSKHSPEYEVHLLIDKPRGVLDAIESYSQGMLTTTTTYKKFATVFGVELPTVVESTNDKGVVTSVTTYNIAELTVSQAAKLMKKEREVEKVALVFEEPLISLNKAKESLKSGKNSVDAQLALMIHFGRSQQWQRVNEHLTGLKKVAGATKGYAWVHDAVLKLSRNHETYRERILERAAKVVSEKPQDEMFLATYLMREVQGILVGAEIMDLLDLLKPVYDRAPEWQYQAKNWLYERRNQLSYLGRYDEAKELSEKLAKTYPYLYDVHHNYLYDLTSVGEYETAYKWIEHVLEKEGPWDTYQENSLRSSYVQFLRDQGRIEDMALYLEKWLKKLPQDQTPYQQYLSVLVRLGRDEEADQLVGQWLAYAKQAPKYPAPEAAMMYAAIYNTLGQGYFYYSNRANPKWFSQLADVVRHLAFAEGPDDYIIWQIAGNNDFRRSKIAAKLAKELVKGLITKMPKQDPAIVQRQVNLLNNFYELVEKADWKAILAGALRRWKAEKKKEFKATMGTLVVQLLSAHGTPEELVKFHRRRYEQASKQDKDLYAVEFMYALTGSPWTKAAEKEALTLLRQLAGAAKPEERLSQQVAHFATISDWALAGRYNAVYGVREHKEELTRTELKELQETASKQSREEWAAALGKLMKTNDPLTPWLRVEKLYLDVLLKREVGKVEAECWEFVGTKAPEFKEERTRFLDEALLGRYLGLLEYLALSNTAQPELGERLLAYFAAAQNSDDSRRWRLRTFRHLVVADKGEELAKVLAEWTKADEADSIWRISLGYVLAEMGMVTEAIKQFELVEKTDELTPDEYQTLSGWYMVENLKDKHEEALIKRLNTWDEYMISNWVYQKTNQMRSSPDGVPGELDPMVLRAFKSLFRKSQYPANYVWNVADLYREVKDFRLVACLAEGVVGHTAQQAYPFLQGLYSVLSEIREEAAVDSAVEQLDKVRKRADTVVDRRALNMLEMLLERRASEVGNQAGPHLKKALKAMRAAFKGEWQLGERRLMATLLESMGNITQKELAKEQLSQLKKLYAGEGKGTEDRLAIAVSYARILWYYSKFDQAIDLLENGLIEFKAANGGRLPQSANNAFSTLLYNLQDRKRFAHGEKLVLRELEGMTNATQRDWLREQLANLYVAALRERGTVSLGKGRELYAGARKLMLEWFHETSQSGAYSQLYALCTLHRTAWERKIKGAGADLKDFAWKVLARLMLREPYDANSLISTVAYTLHDVVGPGDGLTYLVDAIEREPSWYGGTDQGGFVYHSYNISDWRKEVGKLGPLEKKLMAIALKQLKLDLQMMTNRGCSTFYYDCSDNRFWAAKKKEFLKVAEEVLKARADDPALVEHVAEYLYTGLKEASRAIKVMLAAWKAGNLTDNGMARLVNMLHEHRRYKEAIPLSKALVAKFPENTWYRRDLLVAYAKTDQKKAAIAFLEESDKYYHDKKWWNEGVVAGLARACVDAGLFEHAIHYWEEAIPMHQRTNPGRGIGNGVLSDYYRSLSEAYSKLKKTDKAVEAACGAVVSWGSNYQNRVYAMDSLKAVLRDAGDLDAYIKLLDKQVADTGLENPIVRKAVGQVLLDKNRCGAAAEQLVLAREGQPYDQATFESLVQAYDCKKDKKAALVALRDWARLATRDINLYRQLGDRLKDEDQDEQAERAYTTVVEMLPEESESHAMLAEIRQSQDRWPEAVEQWKQVIRIRTNEPEGYHRLAAAYLRIKDWDKASKFIEKLRNTDWAPHFGDIQYQVEELLRQLKKKR